MQRREEEESLRTHVADEAQPPGFAHPPPCPTLPQRLHTSSICVETPYRPTMSVLCVSMVIYSFTNVLRTYSTHPPTLQHALDTYSSLMVYKTCLRLQGTLRARATHRAHHAPRGISGSATSIQHTSSNLNHGVQQHITRLQYVVFYTLYLPNKRRSYVCLNYQQTALTD